VQLALIALLLQPAAGEARMERAAATRCVEPFPPTPPCFSSIQAAINASSFGDRIDVAVGIYAEHITMTNGVSIYGAGWTSTIIDGGSSTPQSAVVVPPGVSASTVLSGAQITGGGRFVSDPVNGGGIQIQSASPTIINTWLDDNRALNGGGVYASGGSPTFNNVRVESNQAEKGGGFYLTDNANVTILGNAPAVQFNLAGDEGGGFYITSGVTATLSNLLVDQNYSDQWGGGFYVVTNTHRVWLAFSQITGNEALEDGGGFEAVNSSSITLLRNNVISNTAGRDGGGLMFQNSSGLAQENTIASNTAARLGGGTFITASDSLNLDANTIVSNTSVEGGGIALFRSGLVTATNNIVARNNSSGSGDGIAIEESAGRIVNNTVADNLGNGIWFSSTQSVVVVNNIVAGHSPGTGLWRQSTASYTADYNDLFGNGTNYAGLPAGANDLGLDPLFVASGPSLFNFYHLRNTSLISETGSMSWAPDQDIDLDFRKLGGFASMGADEFGLASGKVYLPLIMRNHQ
jgi:hypothetical protein